MRMGERRALAMLLFMVATAGGAILAKSGATGAQVSWWFGLTTWVSFMMALAWFDDPSLDSPNEVVTEPGERE